MRRMKISGISPYLIAAIVVITAANFGMSKLLGAHPFWSVKIAWIGVPLGLLLALLVRRQPWVTRLVAFSAALVASSLAAHFGRLRFAASFADDRLAGQFWFYGWIGVAASVSAFTAALLTPRARSL